MVQTLGSQTNTKNNELEECIFKKKTDVQVTLILLHCLKQRNMAMRLQVFFDLPKNWEGRHYPEKIKTSTPNTQSR